MASAERSRSPASGLPRRGRALRVARSATAVKCDGYLNTRARQVLRFVLPRLSWPRRRSAPPTLTASRDRCGFSEQRTSTVHPLQRDRDRCLSNRSRSAAFVASGAITPRWSKKSPCRSDKPAREARGGDGCASAERHRSTAGGALESGATARFAVALQAHELRWLP
jgi:hypothetical protein